MTQKGNMLDGIKKRPLHDKLHLQINRPLNFGKINKLNTKPQQKTKNLRYGLIQTKYAYENNGTCFCCVSGKL